ncbi:MAG: type I restriction endonuclease [Magnetococcus sp. YQC-5]
MGFDEAIKELAAKSREIVSHLKTEEGTKQSLVIPFLQILGYDPANPKEIVPEFVADFGAKKGEKVDYAILMHGKPIMLMECKWSGTSLTQNHVEQLYRYFPVTGAKIGILTNGIMYQFFSDLEQTNQMDTEPFLEVNLFDLQDDTIKELYKFSKINFDLNISFAYDLKHTRKIKEHLRAELQNPTDEFVKLFMSKVYSGRMRQQSIAHFKNLTQKACTQLLKEIKSTSLQSAPPKPESPKMTQTGQQSKTEISDEKRQQVIKNKIVTTKEEIEAYTLVRQILSNSTNPDRIIMRDGVSCCAILFDDNNRKPIIKFYFDESTKKIELFNTSTPEKFEIKNISDIKKSAFRLMATITKYENN